MINCNPETVSTDYDTSDRLYFEPLTIADVLPIIWREKPLGVIVQFGGQTPLKLALSLKKAGVPILGTTPEDIDRAEDRKLFNHVISKLGLLQPVGGTASNIEDAAEVAEKISYPVLVRPSYVLGGRAMEIVYDRSDLEFYVKYAVQASPEHPILIDKFLAGAIEVDVDAISDGSDVYIAGIMEHIEEAGIHSGDSSCVLPPHTLPEDVIREIERETKILALELNVVGLMNIQFAVYPKTMEIFVLEVNPRASRTVPFVSKATGVSLARIATKVLLGHKLSKLLSGDCHAPPELAMTRHYAVKTPVFPFNKFPGVDTLLGPEMKSTGEVMGIAESVGEAFAKAQEAAGNRLPQSGTVFISVKDSDKSEASEIAADLVKAGFTIMATRGTMLFLHENGVPAIGINKILEGYPNIANAISEGRVALVINTASSRPSVGDSFQIRRTALERGVPYFTTMEGAKAAAESIKFSAKNGHHVNVKAMQDYF